MLILGCLLLLACSSAYGMLEARNRLNWGPSGAVAKRFRRAFFVNTFSGYGCSGTLMAGPHITRRAPAHSTKCGRTL